MLKPRTPYAIILCWSSGLSLSSYYSKLSPYTSFTGPLPGLAIPLYWSPAPSFILYILCKRFTFHLIFPYGGSLNTLKYFPCDSPALPLPSLLCWSPVILVISHLYRVSSNTVQ